MHSDKSVPWERLHGKTVLISGGYGMLASYLVYMLIYLNEIDPGANITILVMGRDADKLRRRFSSYVEKEYFVPVLEDVVAFSQSFPRADFVVHAASHASPHIYGVAPVDVILPNAIGTWRLLEKARADKSEGFLFISSGEAQGVLEGKDLIAEDDMGYINPMEIRSCYGESKRLGEALCKGYSHQYGVPAKVVRPGHTYGPTIDLADSRVFSSFVADSVFGRDIHMKSDGMAVRNFCYITDATRAYFKVLLDAPAGEVFNVTESSNAMTIGALALLIAGLSRRSGTKVVRVSRDGADPYLEVAKPARYPVCSSAKLKALGWESFVGVEEGFRRTLDSFVS